METLKCRWSDLGCQPPEWVVSHICNQCGATGTVEICDDHYATYYRVLKTKPGVNPHSGTLVCGACHGSLSYMAQHIHTSRVEEHIQ